MPRSDGSRSASVGARREPEGRDQGERGQEEEADLRDREPRGGAEPLDEEASIEEEHHDRAERGERERRRGHAPVAAREAEHRARGLVAPEEHVLPLEDARGEEQRERTRTWPRRIASRR